jgi:hypothetical protein
MRHSYTERYLGDYKCDRSNKLYVNLSKEDFEYFYTVLPEFGLGSCLATTLMLVFLQKLRDAGIKTYDDRTNSPTYKSLDAIFSDVIGYTTPQTTDEELDEGGAKRLPRKKV